MISASKTLKAANRPQFVFFFFFERGYMFRLQDISINIYRQVYMMHLADLTYLTHPCTGGKAGFTYTYNI